MKFRVNQPAILSRYGDLVISTRDGIPFYVRDAGRGELFTMPRGRYVLHSGTFEHRGWINRPAPSDPVIYPVPRVRAVTSTKHGKAAINTATGTIWVHPMWEDFPEPVRRFVLLHELGHLRHDDEAGADGWAARSMWAMGYNASQIAAAAKLSLSGCVSAGRIAAVKQFAHHAER